MLYNKPLVPENINQAKDKREPLMPLLLRDIEENTANLRSLLDDLGKRLEPVLEITPDIPPPPCATSPVPQYPQALERMRSVLTHIKEAAEQIRNLRNRLEV